MQNDSMGERQVAELSDDSGQMSRRDFASLGTMALIFASLPRGLLEGEVAVAPTSRDATLVHSSSRKLSATTVRTELVVDYKRLPPADWAGRQSLTSTREETSTGHVIATEVEFKPALQPVSKEAAPVTHMRVRYEFVHGPVEGDYRVDDVTITGAVDGKAIPVTHQKMRRSLKQSTGTASDEELRARTREVIKTWMRGDDAALHRSKDALVVLDSSQATKSGESKR